jgi:hypothetical protein
VIDDIKAVIRAHESSRPRSLQKAIGPSEAGVPCSRRLAYKMLGVEASNTDSDPWAAIVGTSVHSWLADAFTAENERLGVERWLTDVRIELSTYMGGSIDLYDKKTGTVIDFKVPGATSAKRSRKDGPSAQYVAQVNLYAAGLYAAGAKVSTVALAFLPRSGLMRDFFWWSAPFDEAIVETTLARIDALRTTTDTLGLAALPLIPTADGPCLWCPFYLPGVTDVEEACAGHVAGANPTPKENHHA